MIGEQNIVRALSMSYELNDIYNTSRQSFGSVLKSLFVRYNFLLLFTRSAFLVQETPEDLANIDSCAFIW